MVFEDNASLLNSYFVGRINFEYIINNEDDDYSSIYNADMEKMGDLDNPLDIEKINDELSDYEVIYEQIVDTEDYFMAENNINIDKMLIKNTFYYYY